MDAVKFIKEEIRMCAESRDCCDCPLFDTICALHETLNRLLWRYREVWDKDSPWDGHHQHWYITKNNDEITVEFTIRDCVQGAIYFSLADNAVDAIEKIVKPFIEEHPDFVW